MSIHDGAFIALDIGLRDKPTPKFFISRGDDDALQWQPPARSRELANALSYHYPLEHTIEEKMQRAILDFLESELPDRFPGQEDSWDSLKCQGKSKPAKSIKAVEEVTKDVPQAWECSPQPLQIIQGSEMFGAWDVKTGKSVKPKGRKRGLSPATRQRVAENRGNTCAYHRKAKTQCHPSQCQQNRLYPGTAGNSIPTGTDQGPPNQKDKSTNDSSRISTEGSAIKTYDDGHLEKRFKALPTPSLSPLESKSLVEGDQTTCCDPDHIYNDSGPISTGNDIHACLFPEPDPNHADGDRTILEGSKNQLSELGNIVQESQRFSDESEVYSPVNETSVNQDQSAVEQFPSAWHTNFHEVLPSAVENGDTDYTDWIEDLTGSELPSLERDWPREDADGIASLANFSPFSSGSMNFCQSLSPRSAINHARPKDTLGSDPTLEIGYGNDTDSALTAPQVTYTASRTRFSALSMRSLGDPAPARPSIRSHRSPKVSRQPHMAAAAASGLPHRSQSLSIDTPASTHSHTSDEYKYELAGSSRMGLTSYSIQSPSYYQDNNYRQVVNYQTRRKDNGVAQSLDSSYKPLTPPLESQGTGQRNEASHSTVTGKSVIGERERKLGDPRLYRENAAKEARLSLRNGVLSHHRENARISIEDLITLLQDSHLRFTGTFEQFYPGRDESSLIDVVLLDGIDQKASARLNPETIRNAFGTSFDKLRLLRSSYDINFESSPGEILPDQSSSNRLPDELKASTLARDMLNNPTETFSAQDSFLIYIGSLIGHVSSTSDLDSDRLVTLLYCLTAGITIAKRAIVASLDPVAQSPNSASYTLRWLDPKWRTVESIIADMDITTNLKARRVSSSRMLSTAPPIINHPPPPLSDRRYLDQVVEKRRASDVDTLESSIEAPPVVQPVSNVAVANGLMELEVPIRHANRIYYYSPPVAVITIKKPIDAIKALWTRLARVKL